MRRGGGAGGGGGCRRFWVSALVECVGNALLGREFAQAPFAARLFGSARRAASAEAEAMLEQVGLGDAKHLYPAQMSGGMQRRVALARASVTRRELVLVDEPTGGLGPGRG